MNKPKIKNMILGAREGMNILKLVTEQQKKQKAKAVSETIEMLSPSRLPWADGIVELLSFMNMDQANQILVRHPGHDMHKIWQSVQTLLDILNLSHNDLQAALDDFHVKAQEADFFSRRRKNEFDKTSLDVNKCMYHLSCTSTALYNITQEFRGIFAPDGYRERYEACYTNSSAHHLIKAIRNALSHNHFAPANYRVSTDKNVYETEFYVSSQELIEYGQLRESDKKYVLKAGKRIKVEFLFGEHCQNVTEFYDWVEFKIKDDDRYVDYKRCQLAPKQYADRVWWSIMIQQIEGKKLDPYDHLDNYFTEEELKEINDLPPRSKQQIDRMIELYDENKSCNEELRKKIYKFLNLKNKPSESA